MLYVKTNTPMALSFMNYNKWSLTLLKVLCNQHTEDSDPSNTEVGYDPKRAASQHYCLLTLPRLSSMTEKWGSLASRSPECVEREEERLVSMTRSSPAAPRKRQTSTAALRGRNSSPAPAPGAGATASEGSYGDGAGRWSLRRRTSASISATGPPPPPWRWRRFGGAAELLVTCGVGGGRPCGVGVVCQILFFWFVTGMHTPLAVVIRLNDQVRNFFHNLKKVCTLVIIWI